ncbi:MAG: RluA family pseudouridine synthase [Bdellovibrionales bacterium]
MDKPTKHDDFDENRLLRTVSADETDLRLDRWFRRHFSTLSHGELQKWLRKGQIRVDGKRADSALRLQEGQTIRLPMPLLRDPRFQFAPPLRVAGGISEERLKAMVIFEDDDVIVLNKPAGLAVQGGTGLKENLDDSLMVFSMDGTTRPKLVHRLDRDTSGVLLIARNDFAAAKLAKAFRNHDTQKIYFALTCGVPPEAEGEIVAPLVKCGQVMAIADEGEPEAKKARTRYRAIETVGKKAAFMMLWPLTGRTHQLRVHMAYLGMPIYGDPLYSKEEENDLPEEDLGCGLHLHARRLIVPHPRGGMIDVVAPLGEAMLKTWRWFGFDENTDLLFEQE